MPEPVGARRSALWPAAMTGQPCALHRRRFAEMPLKPFLHRRQKQIERRQRCSSWDRSRNPKSLSSQSIRRTDKRRERNGARANAAKQNKHAIERQAWTRQAFRMTQDIGQRHQQHRDHRHPAHTAPRIAPAPAQQRQTIVPNSVACKIRLRARSATPAARRYRCRFLASTASAFLPNQRSPKKNTKAALTRRTIVSVGWSPISRQTASANR